MATKAPDVDLTETKQPVLYAAVITTYGLAVIAVLLRFLARRLRRLDWWLDDWLILVALTAATAFIITSSLWFKFGLGLHYQAIDADYNTIFRNIIRILFINELLYSTMIAFVKLSILAFYWRIFNIPSIKLPIKIVAVAVVCWLFARWITIFLHCVPMRGYWDKTVHPHCGVDTRKFFFGSGVAHILMDFVLLILPMPYIRRLQIGTSQKLVVGSIFLLGGFICIASVILVIVCFRLDQTSLDVTWTLVPVELWAAVEAHLAIVSACLPSLRPIYLLIFKGSATGQSRKSTHGHSSSASRSKMPSILSSKSYRMSKPSKGADSDSMHRITVIDSTEENDGDFTKARWDPADRNANVMVGVGSLRHGQMRSAEEGIMVKNDIQVDISDDRRHEGRA